MGELGTRERGFAVAAVRALGARAEAVCARRSAELRQFAAGLSRDTARLQTEATRLGRPLPDGMSEIHESWYDAPSSSARPDAAAWLERRAYGHLVDMTVERADPFDRASSAQLTELVVALGRRRVAIAFSSAPRAALARLCARLGEPAGSELVAEVRLVAGQVAPTDVAAAQQALHGGGSAGLVNRDAARLFTRIGVAWLAPAYGDGSDGDDRLRRLAQRLPRALGQELLDARTAGADPAALPTATSLLASPRLRAV